MNAQDNNGNSSNDDGRIAVLDGLRALAIILVLLRHSLKIVWIDRNEPFLPLGSYDAISLIANGWSGVDLFFVLSGFLITHQLFAYGIENKSTRKNVLMKFFKRRFFRIAPAYYIILTLACLGLFPPFPLTPAPIPSSPYFYHLLFLNDYFQSDIIPIFWSLAIEMKFYLLAPFIVIGLIALRSPSARYGLIAAAFAISVGMKYMSALSMGTNSNDLHSYFWQIRAVFHLSLDGLMAGLLCALLWQDTKIRNLINKPHISNILFFTGIALYLSLCGTTVLTDTDVSLFDKVLLIPLISISFAMMLLGLLGGCRGHKLFMARPLRGIALISYSLYLTHMTTIFPVYKMTIWPLEPGEGNIHLQWLAFTPLYLLLSIIFSVLLYFFIEKPFINWSKSVRAER